MEPTRPRVLDPVLGCLAYPERSGAELGERMPSRSIDVLLHPQYKRNVVLVSSPESAIRRGNPVFGISRTGHWRRTEPSPAALPLLFRAGAESAGLRRKAPSGLGTSPPGAQ
jgi:hypothetical protein